MSWKIDQTNHFLKSVFNLADVQYSCLLSASIDSTSTVFDGYGTGGLNSVSSCRRFDTGLDCRLCFGRVFWGRTISRRIRAIASLLKFSVSTEQETHPYASMKNCLFTSFLSCCRVDAFSMYVEILKYNLERNIYCRGKENHKFGKNLTFGHFAALCLRIDWNKWKLMLTREMATI